MVAAVGIGALTWLVVGGWFAAGLEAEGAWVVAGDEDVLPADHGPRADGTEESEGGSAPRVPPPDGGVASRILVARLVATVPLGVVLALGSIRLVFVTYRELTTPLDVATPIAVRVLRGAPEVIVAVIIAWMLAEIVGAVAARRIALAGCRRRRRTGPCVPGLVPRALDLARSLLASVARPGHRPRAIRACGRRGMGGGGHGAERRGRPAPIARDRDRVRRSVDGRIGARRHRVRVAGGRLDGRRGHSGRGRSGGRTDRRPGHWRLPRSSATLWPGRPQGRSRAR